MLAINFNLEKKLLIFYICWIVLAAEGLTCNQVRWVRLLYPALVCHPSALEVVQSGVDCIGGVVVDTETSLGT